MSTGSLSLGRELDVRVAEARGGLSGNDERILALPARASRRARVPHRGVARAGRGVSAPRRSCASRGGSGSRRSASCATARATSCRPTATDEPRGVAPRCWAARSSATSRASACCRSCSTSRWRRPRRRSPRRADHLVLGQPRDVRPRGLRAAAAAPGARGRPARRSLVRRPAALARRRGRRRGVHVPALRAAHAAVDAPTHARRERGSWSSPTAARTTSSTRPTSCSPCRSRARRCCCRSRPPCAFWRRWRARRDAQRRRDARDARGDGRVRRRARPRRRARADDATTVNAFTERLPHGPGAFEVAVKDTIWMEGLRATRGSRAFADFICPEDAVAVRRLARRGRRDRRPHHQPGAVLPRRHPVRPARRHAQPVRPRRGSRAARAAGPAPRSPPAPCRWRSAPTAAARSAFPPRSAAWSGHKPTFGLVPGDTRLPRLGDAVGRRPDRAHRGRCALPAGRHRRARPERSGQPGRARGSRCRCPARRHPAICAPPQRRPRPSAGRARRAARRSRPRSPSCAPPGGSIDDAEPEPIRERADLGRDRRARGLRRRPRAARAAGAARAGHRPAARRRRRRLRGAVPRRARGTRALHPRVGGASSPASTSC